MFWYGSTCPLRMRSCCSTVTFGFVIGDHTYRLRRPMTIPQHGLVLDGQRTTVWYDPADPGNEKAMVVGLQHALRWNVPVPDATPAG